MAILFTKEIKNMRLDGSVVPDRHGVKVSLHDAKTNACVSWFVCAESYEWNEGKIGIGVNCIDAENRAMLECWLGAKLKTCTFLSVDRATFDAARALAQRQAEAVRAEKHAQRLAAMEKARAERRLVYTLDRGGDSGRMALNVAERARDDDPAYARFIPEMRGKLVWAFGDLVPEIEVRQRPAINPAWPTAFFPNFYGDVWILSHEEYDTLTKVEADALEEKKAIRAAQAAKDQAHRDECFRLARESGERQQIASWNEPCSYHGREECDLDNVYLFAMPDGTTKQERVHTY